MNTATTLDVLAADDRRDLESFEAVVGRGLATFVEVGTALMAIRDRRLYRETHGSFEDYCRQRWDMGKSYSRMVMKSAEVCQNLSTMVDTPQTERQVRPLTLLKPEQQSEAWTEAVQTAPGGKVTAKHVEAVVRRKIERESDPEQPAKPLRKPDDTALLAARRKHEVRIATKSLQGIRSNYRHLSEFAEVFAAIDALSVKP
jgi:hypothetical protein